MGGMREVTITKSDQPDKSVPFPTKAYKLKIINDLRKCERADPAAMADFGNFIESRCVCMWGGGHTI